MPFRNHLHISNYGSQNALWKHSEALKLLNFQFYIGHPPRLLKMRIASRRLPLKRLHQPADVGPNHDLIAVQFGNLLGNHLDWR